MRRIPLTHSTCAGCDNYYFDTPYLNGLGNLMKCILCVVVTTMHSRPTSRTQVETGSVVSTKTVRRTTC